MRATEIERRRVDGRTRSHRARDHLFDDPPLGPCQGLDPEAGRLEIIDGITHQVIAGELNERVEETLQPPDRRDRAADVLEEQQQPARAERARRISLR